MHTHTHRGCVYNPLLNAAPDRKAVLCNVGEVVVASGLLLVVLNQLLPLSAQGLFPLLQMFMLACYLFSVSFIFKVFL